MAKKEFKIYIVQMHTKTVPARIIKKLTKSSYSHIALSFNKDCHVLYSFGRKKYNSVLNGGFVIEDKDGLFFNKFKDTECKIYELNVTSNQYRKLKKLINDVIKNEYRYKYDYVGLFLRYYFKVPVCFENKYVCSYFIAELLEKSKIYKFDKKTYLVEPKDFDVFNNKLIYKGKFLTYS